MKKINVLFLVVFLLVGTLGFVIADEDSEEIEIPEARGVGFFEDVFDRVGFAFMFNRERKIERALELAEKRLAEIEAFAEEDPERAQRAQERYDAFVAKAEEVLEKIEAQKSNDENRSIEDIEKMARIQNKFERHREHADEIHIRALERFRENNASDEKIERFEGFYERALNRSDRMETRILQKREDIIERHKVLAGKSDEELEEILEEIESREGLIESREKRLERVEVRAERFITIHEVRLEKAQVRLNGSNLSEDQKARIQSNLGKLDDKLNTFREKSAERIEIAKERLEGAVVKEIAVNTSSVAVMA
ncbi:hypothetical protein KAJ38_03450 [Candidatus Pacearchaeota archaeon]|nr:hypothetical protein [Candidatus Pacearchaeota archaeon]